MSKAIKLTREELALRLNLQRLAVQGCAILGTRGTGKSYFATLLAELFNDASIPFIAFDPIGVWRWLRVPGAGKGYPIVVAGGKDPDIPLTAEEASDIVRAALRDGVSLVIDLFHKDLSKADWRRIVLACLETLLHENEEYGPRMIFIEEAAEFVPQLIRPEHGRVYDAVERIFRMGGNSKLGITLINQRAEQVNKAALELCPNLFLFSQSGKNSITSLQKWLNIANVTPPETIINSLPTLKQGECWAWLSGTVKGERWKVPTKHSFHPDRDGAPAAAAKALQRRVDVKGFVSKMTGHINDAIALRQAAEQAEKDAKNASKRGARAPAPTEYDEDHAQRIMRAGAAGNPLFTQDDLDAEYHRGMNDGFNGGWNKAWPEGFRAGFGLGLEDAQQRIKRIITDETVRLLEDIDLRPIDDPMMLTKTTIPHPLGGPDLVAPRAKAPTTPRVQPSAPARSTSVEQAMLDSLRELEAMGAAAPQREFVAILCGYSNVNSKGFTTALAANKANGLIDVPGGGQILLTAAGRRRAQPKEQVAGLEALREKISQVLGGAAGPLFDFLTKIYPRASDRESAAKRLNYTNVNSKGFTTAISTLRNLGFITTNNGLRASDSVFEKS